MVSVIDGEVLTAPGQIRQESQQQEQQTPLCFPHSRECIICVITG